MLREQAAAGGVESSIAGNQRSVSALLDNAADAR
jgi:hypothetical protein